MQHLRFAASGYFKISVCRIWQNVQFIQIFKPIWAREGKKYFQRGKWSQQYHYKDLFELQVRFNL